MTAVNFIPLMPYLIILAILLIILMLISHIRENYILKEMTFHWFDFSVGLSYDKENKIIKFRPLPMWVFIFHKRKEKKKEVKK